MTSNHIQPFPLVPEGGDARTDTGEMEVDGEVRIDPDIDDALVDSAEADRLAAEAREGDAVLDGDGPAGLG
jgi:hypothetical protein